MQRKGAQFRFPIEGRACGERDPKPAIGGQWLSLGGTWDQNRLQLTILGEQLGGAETVNNPRREDILLATCKVIQRENFMRQKSSRFGIQTVSIEHSFPCQNNCQNKKSLKLDDTKLNQIMYSNELSVA